MEIGVFTCMTLNTREESRTMRFGILTAIFNLFLILKFKLELGQQFYDQFGYTAIILTSLCFLILGLVVLVREFELDSNEPNFNVGSSLEKCWNSVLYCYCDCPSFKIGGFLIMLAIYTLFFLLDSMKPWFYFRE
jgi:hypothetical protein